MPADNDAPRSNGTRRVLVAATLVAAAAAIALILATDGVAGVIGWGVLGVAIVLAVSLVFLEVGYSEDRDRARGR